MIAKNYPQLASHIDKSTVCVNQAFHNLFQVSRAAHPELNTYLKVLNPKKL